MMHRLICGDFLAARPSVRGMNLSLHAVGQSREKAGTTATACTLEGLTPDISASHRHSERRPVQRQASKLGQRPHEPDNNNGDE